MGTPLPESVPGALCTNCWGLGETFGALLTPKFIDLSCKGVFRGDKPATPGLRSPNRTFRLTQSAPCSWLYGDDTYTVFLRFLFADSQLQISGPAGEMLFSSLFALKCSTLFENDIQSPINQFFYLGECELRWNSPGEL